MALDMTPEQKAIGRENFHRVVGKLADPGPPPAQGGVTRRQFMQGLIAAGATVPVSAAAYFGYNNSGFRSRPVKAGLIGAGDEGGVLVGEHNPAYVEFVAYSDIRPTNQRRIFVGEPRGPRRGFNFHYGNQARQRIRLYENYEDLLADREIEMVVIALPLHLHAPAAIAALRAGKHVLCEKLMAWNISQCKQMIAAQNDMGTGAALKLLSIGHQRHYSMLYQHAVEILNSGILGEIRHIRALWHRNNAKPILDNSGQPQSDPADRRLTLYDDSWRRPIPTDDQPVAQLIRNSQRQHQRYKSMNELVRWRLYHRTGGGLMAELGSHQLDACSIFLGKVKPLHVTALGGKHFYQDDREVEDHVYCSYEFPGKNYRRDQRDYERGIPQYNDMVTVNYSSISTNNFEPYGECVMGSKGTLIIEEEQRAYLWGVGGRNTAVTAAAAPAGTPRLDASSSSDPGERRAAETGQNAIGHAPPSRGYREEMEHMAYLIRTRPEAMTADLANLLPRCDGAAAMADAITALTANKAMRDHQRIRFEDDWFAPDKTAVPDGDSIVEEV
jgi:predicted dehydrogenase